MQPASLPLPLLVPLAPVSPLLLLLLLARTLPLWPRRRAWRVDVSGSEKASLAPPSRQLLLLPQSGCAPEHEQEAGEETALLGTTRGDGGGAASACRHSTLERKPRCAPPPSCNGEAHAVVLIHSH